MLLRTSTKHKTTVSLQKDNVKRQKLEINKGLKKLPAVFYKIITSYLYTCDFCGTYNPKDHIKVCLEKVKDIKLQREYLKKFTIPFLTYNKNMYWKLNIDCVLNTRGYKSNIKSLICFPDERWYLDGVFYISFVRAANTKFTSCAYFRKYTNHDVIDTLIFKKTSIFFKNMEFVVENGKIITNTENISLEFQNKKDCSKAYRFLNVLMEKHYFEKN